MSTPSPHLAPPEISVVIGTLNRADTLERSIRSLLAQDGIERAEILVVDNGSTDATAQVVAALSATSPHVRYVREPKLGLSNARNKGIAEARGALVAFFDDDATAEPGWLKALLGAFELEPDIGAAGGPILVGWPAGKPNWMPASCEGYYGHCNYGDRKVQLSYPQYPYGSNMVIRRELLRKIGGFRNELGLKGKDLMSAEELDLFARLDKMGQKVVYEPHALIWHWVPPTRVTRKWLARRVFKHGVSSVQVAYSNGMTARGSWLWRFAEAVLRCGAGACSAAIGMATLRPATVITSRCANMVYWSGVSRGALWRALGPRP
jgi:glucosyl-dolichyl phosphate glucuronosyltransferase